MLKVKPLIEAVVSDEAYWVAFHQVFGEAAGKILKALLLEGTEGLPGPQWRRAHQVLQWVAETQAKLILQMASGNPP